MSAKRKPPCFIISCARSGSTSLCTILNEATNAQFVSEPEPNLNRETRDFMDGRLDHPMAVLEATVLPRVHEGLRRVEVYGEKNITYGPFIRALYEALECRFVFVKRDGRDVVRSLLNWHEAKFGSIYRECAEAGVLTPEANAAAASLLVHRDTSDYARPRPPKGHPLFERWEDLTRAEMCAYYWSVINDLYLSQLAQIPRDTWIELDYTRVTAEAIEHVADFCGLLGLNRTTIEAMLHRRINSLKDRGSSEGTVPHWTNWDGGMRHQFDAIAAPMMRRLGYYCGTGREWQPAGYGSWWKEHDGGLAWYAWMYESRLKMHEDFLTWVRDREKQGELIRSVADFGCGVGVGYADAFADRRYVGVDLCERNIRWCREHRQNPLHEYRCLDFTVDPLGETFDLVFSSGTLDNCYDIDGSLAAMVRHSRKWIYATFYRGWFESLPEHVYQWSKEHQCFYTDVSPRRLRKRLEELGCREIVVEPVRSTTGLREIPFETRVIARNPGG